MAAMTESCSICTKRFDVQFRYQMEEREGGFAFYCSQACHDRGLRGEGSGGAVCKACSKRFSVELVSQVLRIRGERTYACSEPCRAQLLAEANGARLGAMAAAEAAQVQQAERAQRERAENDRVVAEVAASVTSSDGGARKKLHGPRRLAIFNHKGGTGKTTTSVSVAAGLAERGLRVLLVDTDSQGNVGVSLGVKATTSLYHVLVMGLKAQDVAVNVRPNFDVLVSNETLAAAELYLAGRQNRDRVLRERLIAAEAGYDVVVLDCSPSLSLLNQNALVFADGILVPVACDFLSLVGVRQVLKTVKNVNSLLRHPVQIFGVLPTFYDARARICRDAVETLKEHFGERCLPPIRQTIKIKEAPAQGRTIYEYAPDSNAAEDYKRVVDIIVDGADARRSSASGMTDDTGELAATA
ncbi:ParA family protein [Pendulispora brunnea]|uniref:ParA family protein n=1 Tax=Pendulispora brunnea TaxID=2905690 RepID=A0ABZ2KMA4_9BACT